MNQNNNNFSVLPFYANIDEQNHRKSYAYGAIYPLYAPKNVLLPFQIMRDIRREEDDTVKEIETVTLYTKDGEEIADITTEIKNAGLQIVPTEECDVILFPANVEMPTDMNIGMYYLSMTDGVETWYSEIFTIVEEMTPYLKIEWWDVENLIFDSGIIIYEVAQFKNVLYLCAELGKPEYNFEEEGEKRDGYFFPTKQLSEKTYKCTILAAEFLCDVMRFIRMADNVRITDQYGRIYNADTFLITPKWQTQGDLASVEIEFETDTVVKKLGKGYTTP